MELARVRVVGWHEQRVFDSLVRPYGIILDNQTRSVGRVGPGVPCMRSRPLDEVVQLRGLLGHFLAARRFFSAKFTGAVEEDMVGVETRLHDVQAALLDMFSADTVLVGHSLDSDLRVLRIIHGAVVDTTLVFPLPYKRALRNLAETYLHRSIQNNGDYQLLCT
ncbi:hypothetical protein HPB50_013596 [Hyalomma asiaticum]|uniref:Uncharacterized protein n=1 Tax=Hyalomma asiaticum TaxID=266040 RepID=A0ACB7RIP4_HYAAI|nr:hypothetical protein HPB50_013596 [Hyalomma asiaticum]